MLSFFEIWQLGLRHFVSHGFDGKPVLDCALLSFILFYSTWLYLDMCREQWLSLFNTPVWDEQYYLSNKNIPADKFTNKHITERRFISLMAQGKMFAIRWQCMFLDHLMTLESVTDRAILFCGNAQLGIEVLCECLFTMCFKAAWGNAFRTG